MTGKDLFEAMSFIDERFIDEAERGYPTRTMVLPWIRVTSIAACLCLIMLSLWCIHPLLLNPHETTPPTTLPLILPEGFTEVILYVEEMTEDGFTGTVAEPVTPGLFEPDEKLHVVLKDNTRYELADGTAGMTADHRPDLSGRYVLVLCSEYDPSAAFIAVDMIIEMQAPAS